ncbi:hypothetical protein D9M68_781330 [compost metagenome]
MRTCPRDSGRSWHTDIVKPEYGCTLPPAMSADSVATWNWMSGVAATGRPFASFSARMKQPPWLMPTASGPVRRISHSRPMLAWPNQELSWSLVVMGLLHS